MKSTTDKKELKEYWESIRLQWIQSDYEKAVSYKAYKARLLQKIDTVKTALEVGFGDGRWIKLLRKRGIEAYGVDILENAALQLKNDGLSPVVADARLLPFKENSFDLTYSFGVIEHFEGTEKAAEEHIRVTKPGGKIVITVPYLFSPHTVYWIFMHVKRGTFKKRPATFGKRYTRRGFKEILEQFDVKNVRVGPFLFPIPKIRRFYCENPLLNRVGLMLWAEMIKI